MPYDQCNSDALESRHYRVHMRDMIAIHLYIRSESRASQVREFDIEPIIGTLDDPEILATAANCVDTVINCALSDHRGAVVAMLDAMKGTGKTFFQSSGTSLWPTRPRRKVPNAKGGSRHG